MHDPLYYTEHDSDLGRLLLIGSARGLRNIALLEKGEAAAAFLAAECGSADPLAMPGFFASICGAIDTYLEAGKPLRLPCDVKQGTPLQRAVWLEIARIPYGQTISYSQLAERVGFPRAVRAVASACGANPLPLAIPCHRVIAKDGTLGGFSLGGLAVKEKLLALESCLQFIAA
jgi:AraC family transcriptional regulator, regulatory protein of adaptative response / methylated-DNA-[protein]-cysteine methyltransferase